MNMNKTIELTFRDMDVLFFRTFRSDWHDVVLNLQAHFDISRELAKQIMRIMRKSMVGYAGYITLPAWSKFVIRNERLSRWHMDFTYQSHHKRLSST